MSEDVDIKDIALIDEEDTDIDTDNDYETFCNTCVNENECVNNCQGYTEKKTYNIDLDKYVTGALNNLKDNLTKEVKDKMEEVKNKAEKKTKKFTVGFFGLIGIGIIAKAAVEIVKAVNNKDKK